MAILVIGVYRARAGAVPVSSESVLEQQAVLLFIILPTV